MVLVIYDSNYGNTQKVAKAIASVFDDVACLPVNEVNDNDLKCKLIIAGCPINAWHPTPKLADFLAKLRRGQLNGVKAAAFDTRVDSIFSGNAAKRIARGLHRAGAKLISSPQGFYVTAKEGPLATGQVEKAKDWARSLKKMT